MGYYDICQIPLFLAANGKRPVHLMYDFSLRQYFTMSNGVFNFNFLALLLSEILGGSQIYTRGPLRCLGVAGGQILAFSIDLLRCPYNTGDSRYVNTECDQ